MKLQENIKGVIFDMDGTVLNTEPLHAKAIALILEDLGIKKSPSEIEKEFYGMNDLDVYQKLQIKISLKDFLKKKNEIIISEILKTPKEEFEKLLTLGIKHFLYLLKGKKIKMALVSASEKEVINAVLNHLHFKDFFQLVVSRESTFLSKPSPSPYLFALRNLSLRSEETLIFEDSKSGLMAAIPTGASVIQVVAFSPPLRELTEVSVDNFLGLDF